MNTRRCLYLLGIFALLTIGTRFACAYPAAGLKFEVYQDAQKEYRWRLKDGDGNILGTAGQGYKSKESCMNGVKLIKSEAGGKLTFEVYEDNSKAFRWRAKSSNGQTVASSSSGYKDKKECEAAVDMIKKGAAKAEIEEVK